MSMTMVCADLAKPPVAGWRPSRGARTGLASVAAFWDLKRETLIPLV